MTEWLTYTLVSFLWLKNNIPLCVYTFCLFIHYLIDTWVFFLLWKMLLWTMVYRFLYKYMFSFWLQGDIQNRASLVAQWQRICLQCKRLRFNPQVGKIPWRRAWQPTPVFLPGEFHGQSSLAGYIPWGHKKSDRTEQLIFHGLHSELLQLSLIPLLTNTCFCCCC